MMNAAKTAATKLAKNVAGATATPTAAATAAFSAKSDSVMLTNLRRKLADEKARKNLENLAEMHKGDIKVIHDQESGRIASAVVTMNGFEKDEMIWHSEGDDVYFYGERAPKATDRTNKSTIVRFHELKKNEVTESVEVQKKTGEMNALFFSP